MRRVGLALRGLVLAIFCLVPFGSALAQIPSSVQIFMPNGGLPAAAIMMTLVSDDGRIDTVFTDSKGVYSIRTPNQTVYYTATIKGDGLTYETTTARIRLERNSPGRSLIFLKPIAVAAKPPVNLPLKAMFRQRRVPPTNARLNSLARASSKAPFPACRKPSGFFRNMSGPETISAWFL
ncbi:MAG: hypothetical protein E6L09_16185 [Verrucomicrobia bacterium]|nr:MAG: hypothetical protein E6L09_16185 [Verrucomicrobiota bacterium]